MGKIRFAQVPERVSTKSFVVLVIGNSKSNHLGAQGTLKEKLVTHTDTRKEQNHKRPHDGLPPSLKGALVN